MALATLLQEVVAMQERRHCPRCAGLLFVETFPGYEADLVCVQCGYRSPLEAFSFYSRGREGGSRKQPARRAA
jgi:hypothetical protein